jgi:hypothetical protein
MYKDGDYTVPYRLAFPIFDASDAEEALLKAKMRDPTASVLKLEMFCGVPTDLYSEWRTVWEAES